MRWRQVGAAVLIASTAAMGLSELPHHLAPHVVVPNGSTVYVIGDSLSAGIGRKERCWPEVLSRRSGIPVVNLAIGGATVQTALPQVKAIDRPGSVVIDVRDGNGGRYAGWITFFAEGPRCDGGGHGGSGVAGSGNGGIV